MPAGVLWLLGGQPLFALKECPDFGLTKAAVATGGTDAADPSGGGPSGDRLGVDAEQCGHLAWRQQTISSVHNPLLASNEGRGPIGWTLRLTLDVRPLQHRHNAMSDKR
jgi:hypothetical protein